ncbi:acriflavin resistance protein [Rhodopseudomonas sp.]|uniref:acriflavin resistance protein n=1 Tax=Rhodopseudomonas sp. TaxID=1078 RepID=UPI0025F923C2|nr:acriflavin resistance protein [Rhodopseudomonas sp.]
MIDALGGGITDLVTTIGRVAGLSADGPDSWAGLATSALAGAAAALAVAIALTLYFRSGYRSTRDVVKHGAATVAALALLAFAASDMRHAALDYLGINPNKPAVEFEIRLPPAAALAAATGDTQIELHTDRNQTIAQLKAVGSSDAGRNILRGSVPLDFRTRDRMVILSLPGQGQHLFKLRLAANPSRSAAFGPWHLADRVEASPPTAPDDSYAIRYRVM